MPRGTSSVPTTSTLPRTVVKVMSGAPPRNLSVPTPSTVVKVTSGALPGVAVAQNCKYAVSTSNGQQQQNKMPPKLVIALPDEILATPEQCKLVDCNVPSPTHADGLDSPRLEFGEFQRRI